MKRTLAAPALVALLTLLVTPGQAQLLQGDASDWAPNGTGTLSHEDDLQWVQVPATKIPLDDARGYYDATCSSAFFRSDKVRVA